MVVAQVTLVNFKPKYTYLCISRPLIYLLYNFSKSRLNDLKKNRRIKKNFLKLSYYLLETLYWQFLVADPKVKTQIDSKIRYSISINITVLKLFSFWQISFLIYLYIHTYVHTYIYFFKYFGFILYIFFFIYFI